ncbi:hypothetical protein K505DRAFT_25574 [Melanomma pulvis-pyrius CBS 109.77]|uniref:Uncharacterized protein n=1 Tax=Melanomma pulvis-pyrius CBS 109.77 TaxID=1314802 RepID=A0A6A6XVV8_9PLEO|nr:hypothetical protein K505DRAFT_25574 [Melanomma pulvis-pyrius CBS 109.77]
MAACSLRVSLFLLVISWIPWIGAVPLGSVAYFTTDVDDVVWETIIVTRTVVLCSSKLGKNANTTSLRSSTSKNFRSTTAGLPLTSSFSGYGTQPSSVALLSRNTTMFPETANVYGTSSSGIVSFVSDSAGAKLILNASEFAYFVHFASRQRNIDYE